jgi:hypothetical protein
MSLPIQSRSLSAGPHTPLAMMVYSPARHPTMVTSFYRLEVLGCTALVPAKRREPLCPQIGVTSLRCDVQHHIRKHYPSFIAHTGSWARPKPSRWLRLSLFQRVFAGCCRSLLGDGPSRRYLRNPCIGAWTPTPWRPFGALARFFPKGNGLTSRTTGLARQNTPVMQLLRGARFRGCSHSVMFKLPYSLDPQVAPTAEIYNLRAAGPFTSRNGRVVTLHEL